ncbi:39S ribosomal protein L46, mitochondrial [Dendroctonus ponderosae]|uniref:Large ribosomal subunit protein mL46 n=1 Tax=Dendroctonus ponderosae TaxID=77166 RepID=J3JW99_DENPD
MLKNSLRFGRTVLANSPVKLHSSATFSEKWDLLTAVLIERKPVTSPELTGIEKDFKEYLSAVEFERSLKNDTEINLEKERAITTQKKEIEDLDLKSTRTTQDFIDACKEEFAKFKPAEKTTAADQTNEVKSLQRKLSKHLIFVQNQKIGDQSFYILPQGIREDGETLRQCAERVLQEKCGDQVKAQIFGNAPCGFYKYKYPKAVRSETSVGAKVFIYFARYASGQIAGSESDFKWLDKSELKEVLPASYSRSVLPLLLD